MFFFCRDINLRFLKRWIHILILSPSIGIDYPIVFFATEAQAKYVARVNFLWAVVLQPMLVLDVSLRLANGV